MLGSASFSLKELSQTATITPVADLMESRRAVGGRLMLKFRQRAPITVRNAVIPYTLNVCWFCFYSTS